MDRFMPDDTPGWALAGSRVSTERQHPGFGLGPLTSEVDKYLIIVNPMAGGKGSRKAGQRIAARFDTLGLPYVVEHTRSPGDASRLAGQYADSECSHYVVCGGDGTLHEVVNGLPPGTEKIILALPLGTVNIFAKDYGIPKNIDAALDSLLHGRIATIQPGRFDGSRFLLMLSVGIDSHVVQRVTLPWKRWGRLAYGCSFFKALWEYGYPQVRVHIGRQVHTASFALISKCRHYAGFLPITPRAHPEDTTLSICLLTRPGLWPLLRFLASVLLGRVRSNPDCLSMTADRVVLEGQDLSSQADGEPSRPLPLSISIDPEPLRFLVPCADKPSPTKT